MNQIADVVGGARGLWDSRARIENDGWPLVRAREVLGFGAQPCRTADTPFPNVRSATDSGRPWHLGRFGAFCTVLKLHHLQAV